MTKTQTLKALRIEPGPVTRLFYVVVGKAETYRCFSASVSEKAAKRSRANIRKNPADYGIV